MNQAWPIIIKTRSSAYGYDVFGAAGHSGMKPFLLLSVHLRGLVVLVHYAVTLEVDGSGITNDTLDFISLQSNLVERNYPAAAEEPTVVYTITDLRNYITEALHRDDFVSLETQPDPLQPSGERFSPVSIGDQGAPFSGEAVTPTLSSAAENLLPVKPTSRPADTLDNMVREDGRGEGTPHDERSQTQE